MEALVQRGLIERRGHGFVPRRYLLEAFLPISADHGADEDGGPAAN
jgi:hypothetical protein